MSFQPIPQYEAQLQFRFLEDVLSSSATSIKVDVLPTETAGYCSVFDLEGQFVTKFKWNGIDTVQKKLTGIVWALPKTGAVDTPGTFVPIYRNYTGFYIPENLLLNKIIRFLNGQESFNLSNLRSQLDATAGDQYVRLSQVVALVSGGNISLEQLVVTGTQAVAGEALTAGTSVYFNEATQKWLRTTAGTPSTVTNVILGITNGSGTINSPITNGVTIYGTINTLTGLTPGARYYLSDSLGLLSTTPGTVDVFAGVAVSSNSFIFEPAYATLPTLDEKAALAGSFGSPSNSNRYVTRQDTSAGGTLTATTISFTASTKTISDTGSGLGVFNIGEQIVVTGSTSNNGTYTIVSVSPTEIVVNETLVNETAGASVTITSPLINRVLRTNVSGFIPDTSISPSITNSINFELGENINKGEPVGLFSDGKIYKINATQFGNSGRYIGLLKQSGITGQIREVKQNGILDGFSFGPLSTNITPTNLYAFFSSLSDVGNANTSFASAKQYIWLPQNVGNLTSITLHFGRINNPNQTTTVTVTNITKNIVLANQVYSNSSLGVGTPPQTIPLTGEAKAGDVIRISFSSSQQGNGTDQVRLSISNVAAGQYNGFFEYRNNFPTSIGPTNTVSFHLFLEYSNVYNYDIGDTVWVQNTNTVGFDKQLINKKIGRFVSQSEVLLGTVPDEDYRSYVITLISGNTWATETRASFGDTLTFNQSLNSIPLIFSKNTIASRFVQTSNSITIFETR